MKLRTRIIMVSLFAVFMSSLIINIVTLSFMWKSMKNEAFLKAYKNSYVKIQEFERQLQSIYKSYLDNNALEYYFKNLRNELIVCIKSNKGNVEPNTIVNGEEIYNHTIFTPEDLQSFAYKSYEETEYAYVKWENKTYIVFWSSVSDMAIYVFEDITYVWENMKKIVGFSIAVTLLVSSMFVGVLYKSIRRNFKPLEELSSVTKSIADNKYDQRVEIRKNDEIGQIAENFNKMADAIAHRTKSLEESEKRKTLFMGNLTHELKTPMTSISGYAQTLLSVKLDEEDRTDALNYIYKECTRLESLSQKMMKLLELDYDEELEFEMISAKELFEAAVKSCDGIIKNKNIQLEYEEHGEKFLADFDLMTDVIINLIDNGIKASDYGGKILLRSYGNCIEVEDFGKGIPKEEQEKIMEPFYMVDKSRSRKSGGAGLGLALTALIVKKHNGVLKIESQPGVGTKMILQFV